MCGLCHRIAIIKRSYNCIKFLLTNYFGVFLAKLKKSKKFFPNSKKKKKPSMKDFPKAPEKFREAKGTDFGKRQFHPRKPNQETKTEKLGSP